MSAKDITRRNFAGGVAALAAVAVMPTASAATPPVPAGADVPVEHVWNTYKYKIELVTPRSKLVQWQERLQACYSKDPELTEKMLREGKLLVERDGEQVLAVVKQETYEYGGQQHVVRQWPSDEAQEVLKGIEEALQA